MHSHNNRLPSSRSKYMRSFLINKNLCLYYWLKKIIGKACALRVAETIEKTILILGREVISHPDTKERLTKE